MTVEEAIVSAGPAPARAFLATTITNDPCPIAAHLELITG